MKRGEYDHHLRCTLAWLCTCAALCAFNSGCHEWFISDADQEVQRLIERRQRAALGETADSRLGAERGALGDGGQMYRYVPHAIDAEVPDEFRKKAEEGSPGSEESIYGLMAGGGTDANGLAGASATPAPRDEPLKLDLAGTLQYAQQHGREYQTAKEDLYLSALELSLERHLWTPQFVADVSTTYANYGQVRDFDHAMSAVAQASATQRLPWGGEVAARVVDTLMRDLEARTTSGESGQMILEANVPLLRGAGRVAYESRYQAERNLIYAVRDFEAFRRNYLVSIASDYFDLIVSQAAIVNAIASQEAFKIDVEKSQALAESNQITQVEADRAKVSFLSAQNAVINAREAYESSLDQFKIRLGMATEQPLEIVASELEVMEPDVSDEVAIETALRYRLDLLNTLDATDDARRQVVVAKNNLLPQFDIDGSVSMDTNPNHLSTQEYNTERSTWRGTATLEVPLDRKEERNNYRSGLIGLRRAERDYEEAADRVRADVRRTQRRLDQSKFSIRIQEENVKVNVARKELADLQFDLGKLQSNRDKLDAENDLRQAKNDLADAKSRYRTSILEFLRDTGTLRVGPDGKWSSLDASPAQDAPPASTPSPSGS